MKIKENDFADDYKCSGEHRQQVIIGVRPNSDMPFETYAAYVGVAAALSKLKSAEAGLERELKMLKNRTGIDYTAS